jgi:hypothetical protein
VSHVVTFGVVLGGAAAALLTAVLEVDEDLIAIPIIPGGLIGGGWLAWKWPR